MSFLRILLYLTVCLRHGFTARGVGMVFPFFPCGTAILPLINIADMDLVKIGKALGLEGAELQEYAMEAQARARGEEGRGRGAQSSEEGRRV